MTGPILPAPVAPLLRDIEDLAEIPDQLHTWGDEWDGDYHQGRICSACGESSDCDMCNPRWGEGTDCLRNQAEARNRVRRRRWNQQLEQHAGAVAYYEMLKERYGYR